MASREPHAPFASAIHYRQSVGLRCTNNKTGVAVSFRVLDLDFRIGRQVQFRTYEERRAAEIRKPRKRLPKERACRRDGQVFGQQPDRGLIGGLADKGRTRHLHLPPPPAREVPCERSDDRIRKQIPEQPRNEFGILPGLG